MKTHGVDLGWSLWDVVAVVLGKHNAPNIFTKGLPTALFEDFRSNLCVPVPNAAIEGG